jgi:hypothetical protein
MADQSNKMAVLEDGTLSAKTFKAAYASPSSDSFTITKPLVPPKSCSVDEKSRYLQDLRSAAASVQDQVNKELTQRMEEDKARETASTGTSATRHKRAADDAREEENYGEEVVDAED